LGIDSFRVKTKNNVKFLGVINVELTAEKSCFANQFHSFEHEPFYRLPKAVVEKRGIVSSARNMPLEWISEEDIPSKNNLVKVK